MENKYLEWINSGEALDGDKQMLEDFARWIDRFHPGPSVELTVKEGWQALKGHPVFH
jgi:hypothetical protein